MTLYYFLIGCYNKLRSQNWEDYMLNIFGFNVTYMDTFNIVAGLCSIISLIISGVTLNKVINIKMTLSSNNNVKQTITAENNKATSINQTGRDNR